MPFLRFIGFGKKPALKLNIRWKWDSSFPETSLEIEPGDVLILNLIDIDDAAIIERVGRIVDFFKESGGILFVVSAPFRRLSRKETNYDFLPWAQDIIKRIQTYDDTVISVARNAPLWAKGFLVCSRKYDLVSPTSFPDLPTGAHDLLVGRSTVSFNYRYGNGKIIVLPSIQSIIHGESDSIALNKIKGYLTCLYYNIIRKFEEESRPLPEWLDTILVRNESELKAQYETLNSQLELISEEKSILADDSHSLTKKVASHLEWLGFQTEEIEIEGRQDIEISEGDFKAVVECSGAFGYFGIKKIRQLLEYIMVSGTKGIFIGNPWKDKHPKDRDLSQAFTPRVKEQAQKLGVGLVTVPHLYRVCLDIHSDDEKAQVRDSLKQCDGLWKYPMKDWV